jgi:DNA-dependent RNA polymerase auxiliary subunit epsilon
MLNILLGISVIFVLDDKLFFLGIFLSLIIGIILNSTDTSERSSVSEYTHYLYLLRDAQAQVENFLELVEFEYDYKLQEIEDKIIVEEKKSE